MEGLGREQRLERGLRIVEGAVDADHLQVGGILGDHLQALHIGGAAVGVQAGDLHIVAVLEGFQGGRAGVAAGRRKDQVVLAARLRQAGEHDAEGLQRHVFEGAGGAVVELGDEQIVAHLDHRHRLLRIIEAVVQVQRAVDHGLLDVQLEGCQHIASDGLVIAVQVLAQKSLAEFRQVFRHVQAAERGHRVEDGLGKGDRGRALAVIAAGFDELHGRTGSC